MKTRHFLFLLGIGLLVGCNSSNTTADTEQAVETTIRDSIDWPESLALTTATEPAECYFDAEMSVYAADTSLFPEEEVHIEEQLSFVAHNIQAMALPKEWENDALLRKMVTYYNVMEIGHAIMTDYDAYLRYCHDWSDDEEEDTIDAEEEEEPDNSAMLQDLTQELSKIDLSILPEERYQNKFKDMIQWVLSDIETREASDTLADGPTDISAIVTELVDEWMREMPTDSLELKAIIRRANPQTYLPTWVPDIFEYFVGQNSNPSDLDRQEVFKRFMAAESFDEKAAWGFVTLGMNPSIEMAEAALREVEDMLSSGCYSPLLDPLWRAYRVKYNDLNSCPSTWCYSPNLRYNHFRRMIAYVTLQHIKAHPEDFQARVQYYFMVSRGNIVRLNPYPYGNSSAYESIMLFWNQDIFGY